MVGSGSASTSGEWPAAAPGEAWSGQGPGEPSGGWPSGAAAPGPGPEQSSAGAGWRAARGAQGQAPGQSPGGWPQGAPEPPSGAAGWPSGPAAWPQPPSVGVPGWAPPGPAAGVAGAWAAGPSGTGSAPAPEPPLPAVDPETGLWTAKFLRDRLSSERARSRRSRRPFSLVLVQVPDAPLAALPYRRQLTLLRELGYQFVAGGVVDHLVHVPDREQHWFAVILPDTDRSGAQVLERRLRLGIGGYLSSRGLRLADLQSASLTTPDDDPAMGEIWDALIGPDEADDPAFANER